MTTLNADEYLLLGIDQFCFLKKDHFVLKTTIKKQKTKRWFLKTIVLLN